MELNDELIQIHDGRWCVQSDQSLTVPNARPPQLEFKLSEPHRKNRCFIGFIISAYCTLGTTTVKGFLFMFPL